MFAVFEFGSRVLYAYEGQIFEMTSQQSEINTDTVGDGDDGDSCGGGEFEDWIFVYKGVYKPPTRNNNKNQVFGEIEEYEIIPGTKKLKGGHNHEFHSDSFDAVNARCDNARESKGLSPINTLVCYTDKCPGQYANQFMVAALASYKLRNNCPADLKVIQ